MRMQEEGAYIYSLFLKQFSNQRFIILLLFNLIKN
jgi:hypothetical protein